MMAFSYSARSIPRFEQVSGNTDNQPRKVWNNRRPVLTDEAFLVSERRIRGPDLTAMLRFAFGRLARCLPSLPNAEPRAVPE